jgi:two-component system, NtrC family, nitrogen regulation sensor histidine kinase NtrY
VAAGTHEVAHGNWDYQIAAAGDDELGTLVESFNQMTRDLKTSNLELLRRGKFVETVLANITAGVIAVDPTGKITAWNKAAEQMLAVNGSAALGKNYREAFESESLAVIRDLLDNLKDRESIETEMQIQLPDHLLTVFATAATLRDDANDSLGVMIFLEDITQIQKVQRMEAWREVARRIAHEIKNPLTPIQLSAERLRKRYAKLLQGDGAVLDKCTMTIIQQVVELKNLVNEFSQFARLPTAQPVPNDLNLIVQEALFLFKEGHNHIRFEFRQGELPALELDREQIKRVMINLLDNAVVAVGGAGEVQISTAYDLSRNTVYLEVADDGCGMAPEARVRIFEPGFTTKKQGTGLGLTIVNQIVEDHRGYIRVRPNEPRGTRFVIEFPVREQDALHELKRKAAQL